MEVVIRVGVIVVFGFKEFLNEWDGVVGDGDCGIMVRFLYLFCINLFLIVCFFLGKCFYYLKCCFIIYFVYVG